MIFALPFHINRFFRPALLDEFNYTNTMLGYAFTTYGLVALISYFPGGYIADRYDTKKLLCISLALTSLGGMLLLLKPNFYFLCLIYAYWGITSILFCWSALIKATRIIGKEKQGLSFGILEAGRGLVASVLSSIAVIIYSNFLLKNFFNSLLGKEHSSLYYVICFYSLITFISAIIVWYFYNSDKISRKNNKHENFKSSIIKVFKYYKIIIPQAIIVFTAYSAYKGIDYYTQFFYEILNYSKEQAAKTMSNFSYLRPLCAILAGIIADKYSASKSSTSLFFFLSLSYLFISIFIKNINLQSLIILNIFITMISVFSLRGIYFCFLKETNLPIGLTGIAVGVISLIGYFPDVYIGPLFGMYLDNTESNDAFKKCFLTLSLISFFGLISTLYITKKINK